MRTRPFAKYYKYSMNSDSNINKKLVPMLLITKPPITLSHEVSKSISNYVKFSPVLPECVGFYLVLKSKSNSI